MDTYIKFYWNKTPYIPYIPQIALATIKTTPIGLAAAELRLLARGLSIKILEPVRISFIASGLAVLLKGIKGLYKRFI